MFTNDDTFLEKQKDSIRNLLLAKEKLKTEDGDIFVGQGNIYIQQSELHKFLLSMTFNSVLSSPEDSCPIVKQGNNHVKNSQEQSTIVGTKDFTKAPQTPQNDNGTLPLINNTLNLQSESARCIHFNHSDGLIRHSGNAEGKMEVQELPSMNKCSVQLHPVDVQNTAQVYSTKSFNPSINILNHGAQSILQSILQSKYNYVWPSNSISNENFSFREKSVQLKQRPKVYSTIEICSISVRTCKVTVCKIDHKLKFMTYLGLRHTAMMNHLDPFKAFKNNGYINKYSNIKNCKVILKRLDIKKYSFAKRKPKKRLDTR